MRERETMRGRGGRTRGRGYMRRSEEKERRGREGGNEKGIGEKGEEEGSYIWQRVFEGRGGGFRYELRGEGRRRCL